MLIKSILGFILCFSIFSGAADQTTNVIFKTSMGNFEVELNVEKAPVTVANFLSYVDSGFYNQTIFHRVVKNFVIQGGGLDKDMNEKPTAEPIVNEATNGLSNLRGTLGMARTDDINSATSQFFINTKDNVRLDHQTDPKKFGYAVFAKVVAGMDVVDAIEKVETKTVGEYENVPNEPIFLLEIVRK